MVCEIVKDTEKLSQKCEKIKDVKDAIGIIKDLIDTATYNNENSNKKCCGLAANQIGKNVRVIIAQMPNGKFEPFINPTIINRSKETKLSTEGCMSLDGERTVLRHTSITVMYQDRIGKWNKKRFGGFTAIELQHEIDHTNGILI